MLLSIEEICPTEKGFGHKQNKKNIGKSLRSQKQHYPILSQLTVFSNNC